MRFRLSSLLLLTLLLAGRAFGGPLEEGLRAFQAGDYPRALGLWEPLAQGGNADAQYNLGLLHANGWGVQKDLRAARGWYAEAARQGQADAQYNLGLMYAEGLSVFRSDRAAVQWWERAAAQGHPAALYNLGVMYAYGRGSKKDPQRALGLWEQAAGLGHADSCGALARTFEQGEFGLPPDPAKARRLRARCPSGTI